MCVVSARNSVASIAPVEYGTPSFCYNLIRQKDIIGSKTISVTDG